MTHGSAVRIYQSLLATLSQKELTEERAARARLALTGSPVPLRPYEVAALALPKGAGHWVVGVTDAAGVLTARLSGGGTIAFANLRHPPTVTGIKDFSSDALDQARIRDTGTNLADVTHEMFKPRPVTVGPVEIVRDDRGERINLPGHHAFAEIQRDTVRVVGGKLRYVGWTESHRGHGEYIRNGPMLVTDGNEEPLGADLLHPHVVPDGDDLYLLTLELVQMRDPEPPGGMFDEDGDDGRRRDTRIRLIGGDIDVVVAGSVPTDWNFVARSGAVLVLSGWTRDGLIAERRKQTAVCVHLTDGGRRRTSLKGNARRIASGILVEAGTETEPLFHWYSEDGMCVFPLHGKLTHIEADGGQTLVGWHVQDDTLFLTRYDR